jgi:hypothetical protein
MAITSASDHLINTAIGLSVNCLFEKMVAADRVAVYADPIQSHWSFRARA